MNPSLQPAGQWAVPAEAAAATRPPLTATQKLLLPLGVFLFDWLFWRERAGVNMLVFDVFIVVAQLVQLPRHAAARRSGYFWLMAFGSLLSGVFMAIYGSGVAALASAVSVLLLLGYVNQPSLKLLLFAGITGLGSAAEAWLRVLRGVRPPSHAGAGVRRGWFYGRLLLVPLGILGAFHLLFAVANPEYARLSSRLLNVLGEWLLRLLPDISLAHLLFLGLGFGVAAAVVVAVPVYFFADQESRFGEFVRRQRDRVASFAVRRPDFRLKTTKALDLRKEYLVAVAVFGLVNALLLVVNAIDVRWLWFGFEPAPGFDLAQFVHEGTYVLIFSILLAMGIVLWFFRRNLNFYAPGLRALRWGATVWVLQNAVLAVSVGLRNYYYILHSGVAYKRIGVCFFLLLVFFGLGTVLGKIWQQRSAYSLVRLNSLAVYAVLLLLAAGNWEVWMTEYNLQPRFRSVDIGFLLDMPDRALPTLLARRTVLNRATQLTVNAEYGNPAVIDATEAQRRLDLAAAAARANYADYHDWQGFNWADYEAAQQLGVHE
ncbi:DUF4173 domain-containing protein [Hymenobacter sp. DH14]|uniref:DUF4173 domain-containing protein n=1 Tax=Hymenobacter cyanobacteriorum TaxID=2926463 RepID=A0A9X1VDK3_9BACT|nr:DUF4173 domain-containing protein [Hymenobacter cyanobacteriorum]MCI1186570.1 DUF4173 domain-containing protein [Hymenobacter cyanobacteriorum]